MKQEIRPIETRYKGYRFRSRLEARWAVFFDALALKWEYEPEGFQTSAGPYLPDFRVMTPQGNPTWYEVKPSTISQDSKFDTFSLAMNQPPYEQGEWDPFKDYDFSVTRCALLTGDPVEHLGKKDTCVCPRCGFVNRPESGIDIGFTQTLVGCHSCDYETPCGGDNPTEPGVGGIVTRPHKGWVVCSTKDFFFLQHKAEAARAARFEHGETP